MRRIGGLARWVVVSAVLAGCSAGAERSFRDTAIPSGGGDTAILGGFDIVAQDTNLGPGPACTPPEEHDPGYDGPCKGNEGKLALGVPICGCGCAECCDGVCVAVHCDPFCGDAGVVAGDVASGADAADASVALDASPPCSEDGCGDAGGLDAASDVGPSNDGAALDGTGEAPAPDAAVDAADTAAQG